MRLLRNRAFVISVVAIALVAVAAFSMSRNAGAADAELTATATRGDFKVLVTVAGDLQAISAIEVGPPVEAQRVGVYQMKIATLVPEGTIVDSGDVIAELDRSQLLTQQNNYNLGLQKALAVYEQAKLDTTLNLSKAREDLRNMESAVEEKQIAVQQAKYEAPSVQRQAQLDLEKSKRAFEQAKVDYVTREEQARAKMSEVSADVQRNQSYVDMINDVAQKLTVRAPTPGMVIYTREYNGKKRTVGSMVYTYDGGGVATLPDLSRMQTVCYVNEVDVRRVAVGQFVSISLDSDPTRKLTGKVTSVANVGEERPNSDAKVFEVRIEIAESDTTLRPGMTTSNAIETVSLANVLSVPLEAVASEDDIPMVYVRRGGGVVKQEVATGEMNDTHVVITAGLEEGEVVLLVPPPDAASMELNRLPDSTPRHGDTTGTKSVPVRPTGAADGGSATQPATPPDGKQ